MTPVAVKHPYSDLLTTPDDRNRYEIFEAKRIVAPASSKPHQAASMNLSIIPGSHA